MISDSRGGSVGVGAGAVQGDTGNSRLRNQLLHGLPASELTILRPHLLRVRLVGGQVLHEPGQKISEVFFIESGFASVMAKTPDREQSVETGLIGHEGMTGLQILLGRDACTFDMVNVQMPGYAIRVSSDALLTCLSTTPVLHRRLFRSLETFMAQVAQTCVCNSLHKMPERLARWLLTAADRADGAELPLTQEFLSIMLASARPVVTIAMLKLAEDGVIGYARSRISILNRQALEKSSCSCYAHLRAITEMILIRPLNG